MLEQADIYITISRKCPRSGPGRYIAILEATTEKGTGTLTLKREFEDITPHQLELQAIADSMHRFTRSCLIRIHSDHGWFKNVVGRGWLDKWLTNNFLKNGEELTGADLYRDIVSMFRSITIERIDKDLGSYGSWLESEIRSPVAFSKKADLRFKR